MPTETDTQANADAGHCSLLRKAVERVRRAKAGSQVCYLGLPHHQAFEDYVVITEEWLKQNPEDSEEPITLEWLHSIGFQGSPVASIEVANDPEESDPLTLELMFQGEWVALYECGDLALGFPKTELQTRSDVRNLLKVLGIG